MPTRYPDHKIDEALLAYLRLGAYTKASLETGTPKQTIHSWVTNHHADRYKQLSEKHGPILEAQMADRMLAAADQAAEASITFIDRTLQATNAKDAASYSTAARNLSTVAGISTDKRLILQGRPGQIIQQLPTNEALASMARMIGVHIDSTAEDITPPTNPPTTALHGQSGKANTPELPA